MDTALPSGVIYNLRTKSYWVRADYYLTRVRGGWELNDCIKGSERTFRTLASGLKALSALV